MTQTQNMKTTHLEEQLKQLIRDNYELKIQNANQSEDVTSLQKQLDQMKQPLKLSQQQEDLRDAKCQAYVTIT